MSMIIFGEMNRDRTVNLELYVNGETCFLPNRDLLGSTCSEIIMISIFGIHEQLKLFTDYERKGYERKFQELV